MPSAAGQRDRRDGNDRDLHHRDTYLQRREECRQHSEGDKGGVSRLQDPVHGRQLHRQDQGGGRGLERSSPDILRPRPRQEGPRSIRPGGVRPRRDRLRDVHGLRLPASRLRPRRHRRPDGRRRRPLRGAEEQQDVHGVQEGRRLGARGAVLQGVLQGPRQADHQGHDERAVRHTLRRLQAGDPGQLGQPGAPRMEGPDGPPEVLRQEAGHPLLQVRLRRQGRGGVASQPQGADHDVPPALGVREVHGEGNRQDVPRGLLRDVPC